MQPNEAYPKLIAQLRQDHYEFLTLIPRLTPQYRKNVEAVKANIEALLRELGERI